LAASEAARPSGRRRLIGLVAGALILLFLGLAVAAGWDRVVDYDWELNPPLAVAGFAVLVGVYTASALGYVLILEQLSGRHVVDRAQFVAIWGRSLLGRYVPGNVLMVASRLVLGQEAGIPRRVSLAASVYEQALNLGAAAAGGLILLAAYGAKTIGPAAWLVAFVPLGLLLLHPKPFGRLTAWALRRVGREPLGALLSVRQLTALLGWYAGTSVLLATGVWMLVRSAAGPEAGSAAYVGLSFLASFVVSMLAFVFPSGLGVREGAFALALARNLPGGVAIAITTAVRLVLTLAELVFVAAAVLVARGRSRAARSSPDAVR
jgi:glycosyltransferase 2 family protein